MIMDPNFIVKVLLSLIVAAALAFAVTPLVKRLAQRVGAMDVPKDERRMHKIPIPRMGGLAIFFAFLIAVLCFAGIDRELRGILLGATIIVVLRHSGRYPDAAMPCRNLPCRLLQPLSPFCTAAGSSILWASVWQRGFPIPSA